jgi:hypothetical protein
MEPPTCLMRNLKGELTADMPDAKPQRRINRRWTPMDADKPEGKVKAGLVRGCRAIAEATHHPAFIGVHRRFHRLCIAGFPCARE